MAQLSCLDPKRTGIIIDLNKSPDTRWLEYADTFRKEVMEITDDVERAVVDAADDFGEWARWLVRPAASLAGNVVGVLASLYGEDYPSEIRSIANVAGVRYTSLLLGNLMYDITQFCDMPSSGKKVRCACSSVSFDIRKKPVIARTLDWAYPESLGRHTVVVRFTKGEQYYDSVSTVGCVGVISAQRPGAWALTLNQAPVEILGCNGTQLPVCMYLRKSCDASLGYKSLVSNLQARQQTASPFFAHVIGTKPSQHAVVGGLGKSYTIRKRKKDSLVQTNHFVQKKYSKYNCNEWEDASGVRRVSDSEPRYAEMEQRIKRKKPTEIEDVISLLDRPPITWEATMQQMAMCPASGYLDVRIRA
jgi:hypothetical protein